MKECKILYGQPVADVILEKAKANDVAGKSLAICSIGDDPASKVYMRNKIKVCESVGIETNHIQLSEELPYAELHSELIMIQDQYDGVILQLPTPSEELNMLAKEIRPLQDVDCLTDENLNWVTSKGINTYFLPCTPNGIVEMLKYYNIDVSGKDVVIIGRSDIVGKPMASIMQSMDATVTVCHSKTTNLAKHTKQADIIISAVGKAKMITGDMIKEGCVIIDVGINRDEDGKLCGDVDFESCKYIASAISPVPKGVGVTTTASVAYNLSLLV